MNIGIIGAPGAGKDTLANYLVENKGYVRLAFADQIKKEYYAISGHTEEKFKMRDGTEQEIRDGLWAYSAEMKKKNGDNYFIDSVINSMKCSKSPTIITDIRTPDELLECDYNFVNTFWVVRNPKIELSGKFLPGTKLILKRIIGSYPIFWNDFEDLEETYRSFEDFLGGKMDPDSSKYHST